MCKLLRLIILGPPGSGKGTISSRIVKKFHLAYLSSGDLLRDHVSRKTTEGLAAKDFIDKGQLVPHELITRLILKSLSNIAGSNWLLDGFPRTSLQAEILSNQATISSVINLNVPDKVIIDRLKGRWIHLPSGRIYHTEFNPPLKTGLDDITNEPLVQRQDDKPDAIKARLMIYKKETEPLLDYYRKRNLLHQFSGSYTNEIWPHIYKYLQDLVQSHC